MLVDYDEQFKRDLVIENELGCYANFLNLTANLIKLVLPVLAALLMLPDYTLGSCERKIQMKFRAIL